MLSLTNLGKNDIKWEHLGEMQIQGLSRITYEEVINGGDNATTLKTLYTKKKKGLEILEWEQEHLKEGRYTL